MEFEKSCTQETMSLIYYLIWYPPFLGILKNMIHNIHSQRSLSQWYHDHIIGRIPPHDTNTNFFHFYVPASMKNIITLHRRPSLHSLTTM